MLLDSTIRIVGEAATGESAHALALALWPHVVLLDLNLPDASGLDLCRTLTRSNIGVVMFSLDDSDPTQLACLEAGASSFVSKGAPWRLLTKSLHEARGISSDSESRSQAAR